MKYTDTGFRAVYQRFSVFELSDAIKGAMADYPGAEEADHALMYGYIDKTAGLTLEVIAAAKETVGGFMFAESSDDIRSIIRIESVQDVEFLLLEGDDSELRERFSKHMETIEFYDADEEVEESRRIRVLDGCRHPAYPDDVQVTLLKDGFNKEIIWVRITGLDEPTIIGEMLNEPAQDFGFHRGEKIAFYIEEDEDGEFACYANMNPEVKLTEADLEDGSLLREAISTFLADQNEDNFIDVLQLLRDSYVWIPCNAVLGDTDAESLQERIEKAGDNLGDLEGTLFTSQEDIRLIPDTLQNGDNLFFPVFSSSEEMGEYGEGFSKVQKHFLEVISMAKSNEQDLKGIVVDAFTGPFVCEKDLWEMIEQAPSMLAEE